MLQVSLKFHAQLGQGTATDHRNLPVQARAHQRAGHDQSVDRSATEGFNVATGGIFQTAHLGDRLGQVPPASLVTLPNRLFPGV